MVNILSQTLSTVSNQLTSIVYFTIQGLSSLEDLSSQGTFTMQLNKVPAVGVLLDVTAAQINFCEEEAVPK
jgi:hypothetical protein